MENSIIRSGKFSREEYWRYFEKLIMCADAGTILATLGWVLFWLDHIPDHVIHTHIVTGFVFLGALGFGLTGSRVLMITGNRLGSRSDRFWHLFKIGYTFLASVTGIVAYLRFPPL